MSNEKNLEPGKTLTLKGLELIDLSTQTSFKVYYASEFQDPLVLQCLSSAATFQLLNSDGGYTSYVVQSTIMKEIEPETFMLIVQVREFKLPWKTSTY